MKKGLYFMQEGPTVVVCYIVPSAWLSEADIVRDSGTVMHLD